MEAVAERRARPEEFGIFALARSQPADQARAGSNTACERVHFKVRRQSARARVRRHSRSCACPRDDSRRRQHTPSAGTTGRLSDDVHHGTRVAMKIGERSQLTSKRTAYKNAVLLFSDGRRTSRRPFVFETKQTCDRTTGRPSVHHAHGVCLPMKEKEGRAFRPAPLALSHPPRGVADVGNQVQWFCIRSISSKDAAGAGRATK
jgi:hypothetical protein